MSGMPKEDGSTKTFVEYKAELNTSDTRVAEIASAGASAVGGSLLELSENQKRWMVTGISLNKVVAPALRKYVEPHVQTTYNGLKISHNIHLQTHPKHLKKDGTHKLNYAAINNNQVRHGHTAGRYDYRVTSHVDMAKLYLQTHMAKFSAFDESCDPSAVLGILCAASCFSPATQTSAADVRAKVRNEWAHCNFADWDEPKFAQAFLQMESLVRSLGLTKDDTDDIVNDLNDWKDKGVLLCMGSPVDKDLLQALYQDVSVLGEYILDRDKEVKVHLQRFCIKIDGALQELEKQQKRLDAVEETQKEMIEEIRRVDESSKSNSDTMATLQRDQSNTKCRLENVEEKQTSASCRIQRLETDVQSLVDEPKDAKPSEICQLPIRNEYFSGREQQLREIKEAFGVSEGVARKSRVFGISGLGGCGKTTLAVEYAWRCCSFYKGGIFWISAENEGLFRTTVNEIAFHLETFRDDFDQCLSATLVSLSRLSHPFLMVVDNADELELSNNVLKLLRGKWRQQAKGHIVVTTRRKAEDLEEVANVKREYCTTLGCYTQEEGVAFMQKRINTTSAAAPCEPCLEAEDRNAVTELVDELGGLPLALEQAGSHIKALKCTYSQYLLEFRKRKMKLIQEWKANPPSEEVSKERLAVHTTWLMNFEHASELAKNRGLEELTSVVVDLTGYLNPDDIPCGVINQAYTLNQEQEEVSPIVVGTVLDILTKFSLYQLKSRDSFSVHRLVQQVIQSRCTEERRGEVLLRGVRMLDHAFQTVNSASYILSLGLNPKTDQHVITQDKYSLHTWARLASNAVTLESHVRSYVTDCQAGAHSLFTKENADVLREASIYLSMSDQHKQAIEFQNFMLEILASLESTRDGVEHLKSAVRIPLTKDQQLVLRLSSKRKETTQTVNRDKQDRESVRATVARLRFEGNTAYASKKYQSAVSYYAEAIEMSELDHNCKSEDMAVLYCNRSQCYLKLGKPTDALRDTEECVKRDPRSWKGFFRRAIAMKMLFDEGKEEYKMAYLASAAMAKYLNSKATKEIDDKFGPDFYNASYTVVSSEEEWFHAMLRMRPAHCQQRSIVILESGNYNLDEVTSAVLSKAQAVLIGVDNVKVTKAVFRARPGSSHHFENIVFDEADFLALSSFLSCTGCTFQNGKTWEITTCPYGLGCTGCLICHSAQFAREGNLRRGLANIKVGSKSKVFLIQCTLRNSASGALSANDGSFLLVRDCKVHNHCLSLLEARDGGALVAERNELFDSKFAQGVSLGPRAGPSQIKHNKIYGNASSGIEVIKYSVNVTIEGNEIYQNGQHGIQTNRFSSSTEIRKNDIFENWFWGVNVSGLSEAQLFENVVHHNKCGGIRLEGTPCKVVARANKVTDHNGPGILTGRATLSNLKLRGEECPYALRAPVMEGNIEINNVEGEQHPTEKLGSVLSRCAFCHRTASHEVELKACGNCHKSSYCSKSCQKEHWRKHRALCEALKDRFSVSVDVPPGNQAIRVRTFSPDLKGIKKAPKPDRCSTKRFIVKIQTLEEVTYHPKSELILYDQSTDVDFRFVNETIYHIVVQCGVLGCTKITGKKIFCYASFEENGRKLRIYLNELAPFQEW